MTETASPTACVLIIGNEILSGKTQDVNLKFLGKELARLGIRLMEARVIRDEVQAIVRHVNECRRQYRYVFTTGGIGPTHDDITAASIAQAFNTTLAIDEEALHRLQRPGRELNEARLKMARIPAGAALIDNPISQAPGFRMDNVYVLAGIPEIAQAMFASAVPGLMCSAAIHSESIDVYLPESHLAKTLGDIAGEHPGIEIGSYPFVREGRFGANLVVRGTDKQAVRHVLEQIQTAMEALAQSADNEATGKPKAPGQ